MLVTRCVCVCFEWKRVNKEKRAAGVLDNEEEGKKYVEHAMRRFFRNRAPEYAYQYHQLRWFNLPLSFLFLSLLLLQKQTMPCMHGLHSSVLELAIATQYWYEWIIALQKHNQKIYIVIKSFSSHHLTFDMDRFRHDIDK